MTGTSRLRSALRGSLAAGCVLAALAVFAQAPTTIDQQRALMLEFLSQRQQGFRARWTAIGWREETTRTEGEVTVRSLVEVACPDGYHMRVTRGPQVSEFYMVAGIEYRQQGGKWVSKPAPTGHYNGCYDQAEVRHYRNDVPPPVMAQQWTDDFVARSRVDKGPVRTIRGERCQEWKLTNLPRPDEPSVGPASTYCLSLADGHTVQTDAMSGTAAAITTTTFDWNKPIVIKAPTNPEATADPAPRRRR